MSDKLGGKWEREPSSDTVVVFVHGINSSSTECWTNASTGSYWPTLLKEEPEIESVGIYVYSYETGFASGSYDLDNVVQNLKSSLFKLDNVAECKNIIFVCHSMGGIIARKLVLREQLEFFPQYKLGFFLLASPSLGSDYANHLIIKLFGNAQALDLRSSADNHWLNDLDNQFFNLTKKLPEEIYGVELIEDKFIRVNRLEFLNPILNRIFNPIVTTLSGHRYWEEPEKVSESDHISIAKPENKEATQHRLLIKFIINKIHPIPTPNLGGISRLITFEYREPLVVFEQLSTVKNIKFPPLWYSSSEDEDQHQPVTNRFRVDIKGTNQSWFIPTIHIAWEKPCLPEQDSLETRMDNLKDYKELYNLLQDIKKIGGDITWYGISQDKMHKARTPLKREAKKEEELGEKPCNEFFV
ncbi:MAG: alpha/beta fold hydrolase [Methylobacter sp.]|nr:alpha/beta fold hydrolase [Methylobacter sp.]